MIRKACEFFGDSLLSESERSKIFSAILDGPSQEDFRNWINSIERDYSDEDFQKRKRHFHRKQLRPFSELIQSSNEDIKQYYFDDLETEERIEPITDDHYSPYRISSGTVDYRSPKSIENLQSLTDEEVLAYLNEWDEESRGEGKDSFELITMSALSDVFQSLLERYILPDNARLDFWMKNRNKITRPIYLASIVKAMQATVQKKNFVDLDRWIEFCGWVLTHLDPGRIEGQPEPQAQSADYPDWGVPRRAVVDFIDTCVTEGIDVPITARNGLAKLLEKACSQPDWWLDHDRPLLSQYDPIIEAINNTRSRALQSLIHFGFWIRRQLLEDPVLEVTTILSSRITEGLLTRPEHGLLGRGFYDLYRLDKDWSIAHIDSIFPREQELFWKDAFSSYIRFNRPVEKIFLVLQEEFEYALEKSTNIYYRKTSRS